MSRGLVENSGELIENSTGLIRTQTTSFGELVEELRRTTERGNHYKFVYEYDRIYDQLLP